jgi:RNA polymerase sigma factor (sigma-70 family)
MQQFIDQDDLALRQYVKKIAHTGPSSEDELTAPLVTSEQTLPAMHGLLDEIGISTSELSEAAKVLVHDNLRVAVIAATEHRSKGLLLQSLIDIGNAGLVDAAKNHGCNSRVSFAQLANIFVRRYITREIRSIRRHARRIEAEVASNHRYDRVVTAQLRRVMLRKDAIEIMAGLTPRERDLLRLRFGLDDGCNRAVEEVAELFGVTKERVRQIEVKALMKVFRPQNIETASKRIPTKKFREALEKLSEHEADILRFKWGFTDGRIYSPEEVAERFSIKVNDVDDLEARALSLE